MPTAEFQAIKATRTTHETPRLDETTSPMATVRYLLRDARLTQRELAAVTGADSRTIRRWAAEDDEHEPQERYARRIDDLRDLVALLAETLPGAQTGRWLRARNRYLKGVRPLEALAERRYDEVREAAQAYIDGVVL
jgi:hypothetical protein